MPIQDTLSKTKAHNGYQQKRMSETLLVSYPSDMLPMPKSALRKLRQLADDFIKNVDERDYFDVFTMNDFLNVLKAKLGNEKAFFELKFHKRRYIHLLERWIKTLITHPYSLTDPMSTTSDDSSDDDNEQFVDVDSDGISIDSNSYR